MKRKNAPPPTPDKTTASRPVASKMETSNGAISPPKRSEESGRISPVPAVRIETHPLLINTKNHPSPPTTDNLVKNPPTPENIVKKSLTPENLAKRPSAPINIDPLTSTTSGANKTHSRRPSSVGNANQKVENRPVSPNLQISTASSSSNTPQHAAKSRSPSPSTLLPVKHVEQVTTIRRQTKTGWL